jgi:hypothetical protein
MDAQAKQIKNKVMCEINSFAIVYFFFDDRQQTAWSQGSSKYQKQKKCTRSEISINLSCYVYIIPKRNNYSSNSNKKRNMATILKLDIKNVYPNYQHYCIPISIQVLIPDLIFPVYKIDREQS